MTTPRYFESLVATVLLSAVVTVATLAISVARGVPGAQPLCRALAACLDADPAARLPRRGDRLPGDHAGRPAGAGARAHPGALRHQGGVRLFHDRPLRRLPVYFSIPRVILTIMAAAEKLDPALEEAARSLGASTWRVVRDVILPALRPALIASGAICFATVHGRLRHGVHARHQHRRPADDHLHGVHPRRQFATAARSASSSALITWIAL